MKKYAAFFTTLFCLLLLSGPCQAAAKAKLYLGSVKYDEGAQALIIPAETEDLPVHEFWGCRCKKFIVSPDNTHFKAEGGVLFSKDGSTLVFYPALKKARVYRVPGSVKKIAPMAFAYNRDIRQVVLPKGLKTLGGGAFFGCRSLRDVNLHEAVKLKKITDWSGFSAVSEPQEEPADPSPYYEKVPFGRFNVDWDALYHGTFEGTSISSIRIPDNVEYISEETFRDSLLREATFGKSFSGSINTGPRGRTVLLYHLYGLRSVTFRGEDPPYFVEDGILYSKDGSMLVQVLGQAARQEQELTIGSSVTQVADGAFYHSRWWLTGITFEGPLTSIGESAFWQSGIRTFTAKGSIGSIGSAAFRNCFYLKSFTCQGLVGSVGTQAFYDCYRLEQASIGGLLGLVGDKAFAECDALPGGGFSILAPDDTWSKNYFLN